MDDLNLDYAITKHITLSSYNRANIYNYKSTDNMIPAFQRRERRIRGC